MVKVVEYNNEYLSEWNRILGQSKNGTFLHSRSFMEYHKDHYDDASLLVFDDDEVVAILPANKVDEITISSHSGLTYGGFIVSADIYSKSTLFYFSKLLEYCHENGIKKILFKQIPSFYCTTSQDEIDYSFFLLNARLYRIDIASVIDLRQENKLKIQTRRIRSIKKALKLGVEIVESDDYAIFWNNVLSPNLMERFGVKPVHSLQEIQMLSENNKPHIRQYNAILDGKIMAGTTIFETKTTAHAQYISASTEGRLNGSLDLLFFELINTHFKNKKYFDFGIVNEESGRKVNEGLLDWKEGFGARAYAHRFYEIETNNYPLISSAFI